MSIQSRLIQFSNGNQAKAVRVSPYANPDEVAQALGFNQIQSALFISGGAANMTAEDMERTRQIVEDGIARFAVENDVVVIDGGTEAGIMQMIGEARAKTGNRFPLVGCAPFGKVTYPGGTIEDEDANTRTALEDHHSHFVLVDADYWGAESDMIVGLTRSISRYNRPAYGVLVNGGKIAQYDVYIASARGKEAMPVIVVDGSGRTADSIASASKTGKFINAMIQAIIQGGKIEIVAIDDGSEAMYKALTKQLAGH